MVYIIWVWWVFIIFFLPIVQLNFLIAFISEAFEDVLDTSMQTKYTQRCRLSIEYYMYQSYYFKILSFFNLGTQRTTAELYIVSGDTVVEMSQAEITSLGIIYKIKGVLRELKIEIYNRFVETSTEVEIVKSQQEKMSEQMLFLIETMKEMKDRSVAEIKENSDFR